MAEHGFIDAGDRRQAWRPSRSAWRARPAAARGMAAEAVDVVGALAGRPAGRAGGVESRHDGQHDDRRDSCRSWRAPSLERGLEDLDARQGFRGPSGHLTGKPLDAAAPSWQGARDSSQGSAIVEGIVTRVENDATSPKRATRSTRRSRASARGAPPQGARRRSRRAVRQRREGAKARSTQNASLALDEALAAPTSASRRASSTSASSRATRKGTEAARRALQARRSGARAPRRASARTPRARPLPLALELGPQAAMVVMDPATREILALVGGYDYHPGGFDRCAARAPAAGVGVQADHLRARPSRRTRSRPRRSSTTRPRSTSSGSRRTTRRKSSAARSACARRWPQSINTVAIKVLSDVGLDQARAVATRVGHHVADRAPTSGCRWRSDR